MRLEVIDEEEETIDAWIDLGLEECRSEISQRDSTTGDDAEKVGRGSADDVKVLVEKAVSELRSWDRETGIRVEFVLRELIWSKRAEG